jgi:hypothetical protein
MDLFGKCQGWLTAASPGAEVFEISPEVTNKYYGSLYSESEINLLNPVKISEYLADNIGTVNALCGDGCPNTRRCAECWDLIEELREADQAGNFDRTAELESEILTEGSDCPTACAEVCAEVYPKVRQATGSVLNPELGKGLISTGIQLN